MCFFLLYYDGTPRYMNIITHGSKKLRNGDIPIQFFLFRRLHLFCPPLTSKLFDTPPGFPDNCLPVSKSAVFHQSKEIPMYMYPPFQIHTNNKCC